MRLRTIGRHGKEGLKNLGRNGWMTFASISSVTVALLLVGFFTALMMNMNHFSSQVKHDVEVKVYISKTASDQQINQLQQKIKDLPLVADVKFVSKKEGLSQLIDSMSRNGKGAPILESLRDQNPLPNSFVVKAKNPEDTMTIAKEIKPFDNVHDVKYGDGKGTVKKLFHITDTARTVGIVIIIGLLFTTVFLIGNTIKLTIISRKNEIEIMKLVGATNGFIRWPFFVEGFLLGVLGAVIPIVLLWLGYRAFYSVISNNLTMSFIEVIPIYPIIYYLSGGLLLIGAFIGVWGSVTSVRKFLRV
ncbi:MAG TPA: permease-like cell division protein FtsX [Bacillales bacterium]|nr:permease-like cell division protein FtsX [Bacillales bacterium]